MRKWAWGGGVVVVVLGAAGALLAAGVGPFAKWKGQTGSGEAKASAAAAKAAKAASAPTLEFRSTEVVRPQLTSMPRELLISGALVAPNTAVVRAKAAGTLLSLAVVEGQRVSAQQALGRIDVAELNSRVAERDAHLESARAALQQVERSHASNERLAAQAFISAAALDNSRSQVDAARAALAAAQAALGHTRVGLREAAPLAPIAGIVAKRHVLPGEKLSMEQPLVTLVDLRVLELAGSVGTHEVALLRVGMAVQVQVEGLEAALPGRLARIAPAAEPGTRSIGVTISLANPGERLRAGQYAQAQVQLADDKQRLALPSAAIGSQAGQSHVWLIDKGVLARRAVTTGRHDEPNARVEVLSGVAPTDEVLAARFDNLREGGKALILADKPSGTPTNSNLVPASAVAAAATKR